MTKSEARRLIYEGLRPVVEPAGFRVDKRAEGFVREIIGGKQILGVALWDYNPIVEFSLTMCVRLDAVQVIVNRFSGSPPKYHAETMTSITQLEHLGVRAEPGRGVRYRAESEPELLGAVVKVAGLIRERLIPFFDQHQDVASLDRGLNPCDDGASGPAWLSDRRSFDATNQPYRAMAGVAVAYLAGNPRLQELVAVYRGRLSALPEPDRCKYEHLVAQVFGGSAPT
jgi:hypothetical protein